MTPRGPRTIPRAAIGLEERCAEDVRRPQGGTAPLPPRKLEVVRGLSNLARQVTLAAASTVEIVGAKYHRPWDNIGRVPD